MQPRSLWRRLWVTVRETWGRWWEALKQLAEQCLGKKKAEPDWLGAQVYPILKMGQGVMQKAIEMQAERRCAARVEAVAAGPGGAGNGSPPGSPG